MPDPKVAVLGTGANGASIGADLTRAGFDVTFVEQWPEHVKAMRAHGVTVEMPDTTEITPVRVINLCEVATLREPFDVVLVLMKAYDTRWACELIKPLVASHGLVVGLQNGMTIDVMSDVMGEHRTIGSVIEVASTMFDPGVVCRDTTRARSWFAVGGLIPASKERAVEVADMLRHSGTVEVTDDIRSAKWMKLSANATELVTSAILDMPVMEAVLEPGMREIMVEAGVEALTTAVACGHRIVPIFGMPAVGSADPRAFAQSLLDVVHDEFSIPGQLTTVLQDWRKGRRSEVHEINGHVVREQRALGGRAPVNEAIVEIAGRIESGELPAGLANRELLVGSVTSPQPQLR